MASDVATLTTAKALNAAATSFMSQLRSAASGAMWKANPVDTKAGTSTAGRVSRNRLSRNSMLQAPARADAERAGGGILGSSSMADGRIATISRIEAAHQTSRHPSHAAAATATGGSRASPKGCPSMTMLSALPRFPSKCRAVAVWAVWVTSPWPKKRSPHNAAVSRIALAALAMSAQAPARPASAKAA